MYKAEQGRFTKMAEIVKNVTMVAYYFVFLYDNRLRTTPGTMEQHPTLSWAIYTGSNYDHERY